MIPTPITQGTQGPVIGTVQLTVDDPNGEVANVEFFVTGSDGIVRGPFGEDRLNGSTYEREVLLGRSRSTRVQPRVVLVDGTTVDCTPALFGVRFEPIGKASGNFTQCTISAASGAITVQALLDANATDWRVWASPGSYPSVDGTALGAAIDRYLRYDSAVDTDPADRSLVSFAAAAGSWYVIAAPYNAYGQAGPRATQALEVV